MTPGGQLCTKLKVFFFTIESDKILSEFTKFEWGDPNNNFIQEGNRTAARRNFRGTLVDDEFEQVVCCALFMRKTKTRPFKGVRAFLYMNARMKKDLTRLILAGNGSVVEDFR